MYVNNNYLIKFLLIPIFFLKKIAQMIYMIYNYIVQRFDQ